MQCDLWEQRDLAAEDSLCQSVWRRSSARHVSAHTKTHQRPAFLQQTGLSSQVLLPLHNWQHLFLTYLSDWFRYVADSWHIGKCSWSVYCNGEWWLKRQNSDWGDRIGFYHHFFSCFFKSALTTNTSTGIVIESWWRSPESQNIIQACSLYSPLSLSYLQMHINTH